MNRFLGILTGCLVVASAIGCSVTPTAPATAMPFVPCEGKAIVFGDISEDTSDVIIGNTSLAEYVAGQLAEFGYECGKVVATKTVDEMIAKIKNQEVDIYMDSMYPATLVSLATGAQPILRRWRNCDPEYSSVIFTTADSGITSVEQLPGHMIAMDRSYSTSGFAIPAAFLLDHGLNLVIKESFDEPVGVNVAGIHFSLDDKNTKSLVEDGFVVAGVTDDYFFSKWEQEAPGKFVKLAETESVPRQAVLMRPSLAPELREAIKKVLLEAHLNPEGALALEKSAETCKFDDAPGGIEQAFARMQQIHTLIQQIPGWQNAFQIGH